MKRLAIAILSLVCAHGLYAQKVIFTAKASKVEMAVRDTVSVEFTMNVDADNFKAPDFEGFDIIAGPSQKVSQAWTKGERTFEKSYFYKLRSKTKGPVKIGKASIELKGKTYWTEPIFVEVMEFIKKMEAQKRSDSLFIKLEGIPEKMRVNDTIKLAYKLYFPSHVGIGNWKTSSHGYDNFEVLPTEAPKITVVDEELNGQKYRWAILHNVRLVPKNSGLLRIEPRTFIFAAEIANGTRDFFGKALTDKKAIEVTTEARQITVAP